MKKSLRIILISLGVLITLVISASVLIPIIYKDDINQTIQKAINEQINAVVNYDANSLSISLLSDFPNLSVSLENISIVGVETFEGDTLLNIQKIALGINLKSLLFGDKIQVNKIFLEKPYIQVLVTKEGLANYNILKTDTTSLPDESTKTEPSKPLSVGIEKWKIQDAHLIYNDSAGILYAEIWGFIHQGKGDFTANIFDMKTNTRADSILVVQGKTTYLKKASTDIDITLGMDLDKMKFTFKDNSFKLNDLGLQFDGWFQMLEGAYDMDITFKSLGNKFSSVLSMIPGVYTQDFKSLKTGGTFSLDGFIKGKYAENPASIPGFLVNLKIDNGMFQYKDLPTAINNITLDMTVDATDGNILQLLADVRKFHADLGKNPVDARLKLKGLEVIQIDADLKAQLDLSDIVKMYPLDAVKSLSGMYGINLKANGIYSDKDKKMPQIEANMKLSDGAVQAADYPVPIEKIEIVASVTNTNGNLSDTRIVISDAKMMVNGEPFEASAQIQNLDDITYEAKMTGKIDLDLVNKLAPIEGTTLSGKLFADITTKGKMSDIEASKYDRLPTSGKFELTNFSYTDKIYLPQGMKVAEAKMSFTPMAVNLEKFIGNIGKNDFNVNGQLTNYIAFILSDKAILKGNLDYKGSYFNVNDFMPKTEDNANPTPSTTNPVPTQQPQAESAGVAVPRNIDFRFDANIKKVIYDNLELENMTGTVGMKDGIISMNNLRFSSLGGIFAFSGTFNAQNPEKPSYTMNLDIKDLACEKAYANFVTVKSFTPIAQNIRGLLSTTFNISGVMKKDFSPDLQSVSGTGVFNLKEGQVQDVKALNMLANQLGMQSLVNPKIGDIKALGEISNGRMFFKPFDVKVGDYKSVISGSTGLDGSLDYAIVVRDVPIGQLAASYLGPLASFLGDRKADIPISVKGTYDKPTVLPGTPQTGAGGTDIKQQAIQDAKQVVKENAKDAAQQMMEGIKSDTSSKPIDQKVIEQGKKIIDGFLPRRK